MKRLLFFLFLIRTIGFSLSSAAAPAPELKRGGHMSFLTRALGESCWGFNLAAETLPCNPAFIAFDRDKKLKANLYFGNNLTVSKEISQLLANEADSKTIESLFKKQSESEFESQFELGYLGKTWGASLSPVQFYSSLATRNPALPEIDLFASQEEVLRLQFGSYWRDDVFVGVELRALHRKFVANKFFLIEILTQNGLDLLQTKEQNILFVDPSFVYAPENLTWNPQVYLSISDFGFADKKYDSIAIEPTPHLGGAIKKPFGIGDLGLSLDLSWRREYENAFDAATLGAYYEFGILRLLGHLNSRSDAFGFEVFANSLHIGLLNRNEELNLTWGESLRQRRTYLVLGAEI